MIVIFVLSFSLVNASFVDIFTTTLLPVDPPFQCYSDAERRTLKTSIPAVFNAGHTSDLDELVESVFSSDSPFAVAASLNTSDLIDQLERDLTGSSSNSRNSLRHKLRSSVETVDLIQSISELLFSPHVGMEDDQTPGQQTPGELQNETTNPMSLIGFLGSGEIMLCAAADLFRGLLNPQNVGKVLCKCAGKAIRKEGQCRIISSLSTGLGCMELLKCSVSSPTPYVPPLNEVNANLPMLPGLPTPQTIPKATVTSEIQTYYLFWKSIALLQHEAKLATCSPPSPRAQTIPGWTVQLTANLVESKRTAKGERAPFARLATHPNGANLELTDFLISVRGTQTPAEWGIDFSYNQVLQDLDLLDATPLHRGFAALASAVWSPFQLQLKEAFDTGKLGLITTTGHSLGGGVAAVLAHLFAKQFPKMLPDDSTPRHRVVLFAPGRAGGSKLMSDLSESVIVRTIASEFDPIPLIPCDTVPGCTADLVPVPTARDSDTIFTFNQYPGLVEIKKNDLTPDYTEGKGINLKMDAWHM